MSTFTKEQLIEHLRSRIEHRKGLIASIHIDRGYRDYLKLELRSSEIALASLEAEAVGEVVLGEYDDCGCHPDARVACIATDGQADWENFKDGTRLYTAPPAPVSVPDAMEMDDDFDSAFEHGKAVGWNAYRAAMLQSFGNSEQLNSPVIPDGWVMVPVELTPDMRAAWDSAPYTDDDDNDMQAAYRAMIAAAPHDTPALNSVQSVLTVLGKWIPVSERMPELDTRVLLYFSDYSGHIEDGCIGDEGDGPYHYFFDGDSLSHEPTHWMPLPAAPQQEVNNG